MRVIYEICQTNDGKYWCDYFDRSEAGATPDLQSSTMTLKELLEFIRDAVAAGDDAWSATLGNVEVINEAEADDWSDKE